MGILGSKTWKMENVAENDRKEGIRTRQGFGELKRLVSTAWHQFGVIVQFVAWKH